MREFRYFSSITLIGFGLFYYLKSIQFAPLLPYYTWATLSIILGIAFIIQARSGGQTDYLLPGVMFLGYGLHHYLTAKMEIIPDEWTVIFLLIALGLLLIAIKKGTGKGAGIMFLAIAIIFIFQEKIRNSLGLSPDMIQNIDKYWPLLFVIIGVLILYKKK